MIILCDRDNEKMAESDEILSWRLCLDGLGVKLWTLNLERGKDGQRMRIE
jgi:hypothetical protein